MIGQSQYCACPVPLAALLFYTNNLPHREPVKNVRVEKKDMGIEYVPRKETAKNKQDRSNRSKAAMLRLSSALSKKTWTDSNQIAAILGITSGAAKKAMDRDYMAAIVHKKTIFWNHQYRCVWRLKK